MTTKKAREQRKYNENYDHIPTDMEDRLRWMCDDMNLSGAKMKEILDYRDQMMRSLYYIDFNIQLYEMPKGAQRPRFRLINRKNFANSAMSNANFVHVYTPDAKSDHNRMKRMTEEELQHLDDISDNLICTPCIVEYNVFQPIPKNWSQRDTFLAEIGVIRPMTRPDFDNLAKKYADMYNGNIWLDDAFVIEGTTKKYYSILPRIEINLRYLNYVYSANQLRQVSSRKDFAEHGCSVEMFEYEEEED